VKKKIFIFPKIICKIYALMFDQFLEQNLRWNFWFLELIFATPEKPDFDD
jgi:hypothetical protein